jgi:hypothetical protein
MKLAGPAAMMEVLLLTNRPAPMMPPMDIIVKCRPLRERLSSFVGEVSAGCGFTFVGVIGHPLLYLPA